MSPLQSVSRRGVSWLLSMFICTAVTAAWLIVTVAIRLLNHELAAFGDLFGLSPRLGMMSLEQTGALLALAGMLGWLGAWMSVSRHLWQMNPR